MNDMQSIPRAPAAYPVTFDREGRQLFGWYHPPAVCEGQTRDCVVVMCNPIGYDAICIYRHYRVLALRLADAGFAVLRYDHHGTGNSAGSDEDPKRITAWVNGVSRATEFAQRCSGASKISFFGVRLGGTLAMASAAQSALADSIIAWAPFPTGSNYLREMRALRLSRDADAEMPELRHDAGADLGEEAAGYLLTRTTIAELGALSLLTATRSPAPAALLLARDDLPQSDKLAKHLSQIGCEVTALKVPGYAGMMRDTFDAVVPVEAMGCIADWLSARYPLRTASGGHLAPVTSSLLAGPLASQSSVVETPVNFGDEQRLFGIVSAPAQPQGDRGRTGVIFVSVGSNHLIGPNRMYVTQARALAALGFVTLRMDIGGVGESPPSPGHRENHLYAMHSVADVQAAIRYLREQQQLTQIVLIGLCSGAYLSFHTAVADAGVAGIVLINPQTFTWREGDSLELRMNRGIKPMGFYRKRFFSADTWKRLITGKVNVGVILGGIFGVIKKRLAVRLVSLMRQAGLAKTATDAPDVRGSFRKLLGQNMNVFLLYSANDGGLAEMGTQLGRHASSLRKSPHFRLEIVDGADHTFTPLWAQRRLLDLLTQHFLRLYG